ncbi:molybdopterin molybdotransferase MoeA [Methylocella silvestris]|uniref:Molybdopterin molybdenumtransferase n=1 Tax=Methylocella silvestris TaxID=199596 RepID=A0A2J7TDG5_METSI|nr:gephyrin-like molybdotransferase Glp [Methylocella silvestris]PNG24824.1 molybdopterin molybdenumtransferase MoeA [Methylocella silvestris]
MSGRSSLTVDEAKARILAGVSPDRPREMIPLARALGRTLAADLAAGRTQPPYPVSAMDGYAVRAADLSSLPARLKQIGESAAGHAFAGKVGPMETARIFTGARVPDGADAILIQENARVVDGLIEPLRGVPPGLYVRKAGLDFIEGATLLKAGTRLGPGAIALAAAMNHAELLVARRPRVGILATGDELVAPGAAVGVDEIVASNGFTVSALVEWAGGEPVDFGIVRDDLAATEHAIGVALDAECDVLVTSGGASVGDHDLVRPALLKRGMELDFWRILLRPGAPLVHGRLGATAVVGLPGNPVSATVCAILFLCPLVRALSGDPSAAKDSSEAARLGAPVRANDARQDFMRATLARDGDGMPVATPFDAQDSSLLSVLARAECLVIRPSHAPAAEARAPCRILRMPGFS